VRLHRLRLTAIGPFPGTEEVDVDALSAGGLFLFHGPTGAGKTTVLDAICFALYGRVPGARGTVLRLRSDHAGQGVAPEVVCEFSVGERRFEITRSPAWERPKKRGTGTTTEQPRVAVRERDGDQWRTLTTRADEAAQLVDQLLGLGLDQFTKLVLLPQGEFSAFLRADAEDRRQMLERLFATDRFAAVQQWMRQHQLDLRRDVAAAQETTRVIVARAWQAVAPLALPGAVEPSAAGPDSSGPDSPGPDSPGPGDPADALSDAVWADPAAELAALERAARQAWEDATAQRLGSAGRLERAAQERRQGEHLAARQQEHAAADQRRATLLVGAVAQADRRHRIEEAVRAEGLVPVSATLDAASRRAQQAAGRLATSMAEARRVSPLDAEATAQVLGDPARMDAEAQRARESSAALEEAERDLARLADLDQEITRHETAVRHGTEQADRARRTIAELEAELARLRDERTVAATLAAREDDVRSALAGAQAVVLAVERREQLRMQLDGAQQARDAARRDRDDLRQAWLDLRERRLAGIAAELAAGLAAGRECPVCGSPDHPRPATTAGAEPVDAAAERAAQRAVEHADGRLLAAEQKLADLGQLLATVTEQAGDLDPATAAQRRSAAADELDAVLAARTGLTRAQSRLGQVSDELAAATAAREAAETALGRAAAALAAVSGRAAELREGVAAATVSARPDGADLAGRRCRLQSWIPALATAAGAYQEATVAQALLDDALVVAEDAAAAAGFPTVAQGLAAVAAPAVLAELRGQVRRYDDELAAVEDRLRHPELAEAAARPVPSLPALRAVEDEARLEDDAAAARAAVCETAVDALRELGGRLRDHLRVREPVLARYRTCEQLSRCLDGTGGDNTRRMSLSAYVLAARLEQVAQAASERLAAMSGGRYSLVHSDDLERGRVRSGLSLKVVDEWTGARRETSSLSGGESFYTALALALGLADVVAAEAGGAVVETLFVDEGFGSLDEDTLDEVMDVLDGLRSGGRAVGLVSHVPDLRQRIPSRLEVVKTRLGSTLRPAVGA
jgi:exonuclease SbcC